MADAMKNLARAVNQLSNETHQKRRPNGHWWLGRKQNYVNRRQWEKNSGWHGADWRRIDSSESSSSNCTGWHASGWRDWDGASKSEWAGWPNDGWAKANTEWSQEWNDWHTGWGAECKPASDKWVQGHWCQGTDGWWSWQIDGGESPIDEDMSALSLDVKDDSTPKARMVAEVTDVTMPQVSSAAGVEEAAP
eukprot:GEMP01100813.1.p1 GENE.GEMP01100813.1~~GEMP01100813.1.p1  ORF type:complete len:209 (+),score=56.32 GEMP01100813.1:52-627(+)